MKVFGLACLAAVNPKLLAVDLILAGNRRPRLIFACFIGRSRNWPVGDDLAFTTIGGMMPAVPRGEMAA